MSLDNWREMPSLFIFVLPIFLSWFVHHVFSLSSYEKVFVLEDFSLERFLSWKIRSFFLVPKRDELLQTVARGRWGLFDEYLMDHLTFLSLSLCSLSVVSLQKVGRRWEGEGSHFFATRKLGRKNAFTNSFSAKLGSRGNLHPPFFISFFPSFVH